MCLTVSFIVPTYFCRGGLDRDMSVKSFGGHQMLKSNTLVGLSLKSNTVVGLSIQLFSHLHSQNITFQHVSSLNVTEVSLTNTSH